MPVNRGGNPVSLSWHTYNKSVNHHTLICIHAVCCCVFLTLSWRICCLVGLNVMTRSILDALSFTTQHANLYLLWHWWVALLFKHYTSLSSFERTKQNVWPCHHLNNKFSFSYCEITSCLHFALFTSSSQMNEALFDVQIRSGGCDQWVTPRSQGLKAHEEGNNNPYVLKCRWRRSAAERPEDEQAAEREGGWERGRRNKKREIRRRKRQIRRQVAEWGDVVEMRRRDGSGWMERAEWRSRWGWNEGAEGEERRKEEVVVRESSWATVGWSVCEREHTLLSGSSSSSIFFMMQLFFSSIHTVASRLSVLLGSCAAFSCFLSFVLLPGSRQCRSSSLSATHTAWCVVNHQTPGDEAPFKHR